MWTENLHRKQVLGHWNEGSNDKVAAKVQVQNLNEDGRYSAQDIPYTETLYGTFD